MNAREIFDRLVAIAHGYSMRYSGTLRPGSPRGKPGELLTKLSPEEREELKNLSSKDIAEPDRTALAYMQGEYPENTTSVHSHSIKKDEE